jgi:DNA-binding GntR family transcriptional regulator
MPSAERTRGPGTSQEHAVDWLRQAIVEGELRPGDRVLQEELAARIGVSVVPVREALRVLEGEGQVTYLPRRGYVVTELNLADLVEIYELRQTLEARAAERAVAHLDDAGLERVLAAAADHADAVGSGDVAAALEANRRFHFAVLEAPGQPHTLRVVRGLWERTEAYRALLYNASEERFAAVDAHDGIVEALRERDAEGLVRELDAHRERALGVLGNLLPARAG